MQTVNQLGKILQARNAAQQPSTVFVIGDVAYARGYAYLWEFFMAGIQPVAATVPWMVGVGNHEYDYIGQPWKPSWSDFNTDSGTVSLTLVLALRDHLSPCLLLSLSLSLSLSLNLSISQSLSHTFSHLSLRV
jgi:hypothetical protein